jgi:hypothetical protein
MQLNPGFEQALILPTEKFSKFCADFQITKNAKQYFQPSS